MLQGHLFSIITAQQLLMMTQGNTPRLFALCFNIPYRLLLAPLLAMRDLQICLGVAVIFGFAPFWKKPVGVETNFPPCLKGSDLCPSKSGLMNKHIVKHVVKPYRETVRYRWLVGLVWFGLLVG